MRLTYIGGPTALLEIDGLRLLTDQRFDPAGSEYPAATYVLRKTEDPAVTVGAIGEIDAVLLSHDHHSDNLVASSLGITTTCRHPADVFCASPPRPRVTDRGAGIVGPSSVSCSPFAMAPVPSCTYRETRSGTKALPRLRTA